LLAQHEKSAIAAEDMVARKLAWLEHVFGVADEAFTTFRSWRALEKGIDRNCRGSLNVELTMNHDAQRDSDRDEDTQTKAEENWRIAGNQE
jgi:hypothetical protein